jgi:hypothetical protein
MTQYLRGWQLSRGGVSMGIELSNNDSGKTFIRLPSGARYGIEVWSSQLSVVDPVVVLVQESASVP